jgi:hypothetical protein
LLAIGGFLSARSVCQAGKTPEKRLDKDEAREAAAAAMRDFANSSIRVAHTEAAKGTTAYDAACYENSKGDRASGRRRRRLKRIILSTFLKCFSGRFRCRNGTGRG